MVDENGNNYSCRRSLCSSMVLFRATFLLALKQNTRSARCREAIVRTLENAQSVSTIRLATFISRSEERRVGQECPV